MRISDWSSDVCSSDLQAGSGTLVGARLLLESFGLAESAIEVAYLKSDDAMERLVAGKLDAFFLIAGYPAKVVQWAGEQTAISLVPYRRADRGPGAAEPLPAARQHSRRRL